MGSSLACPESRPALDRVPVILIFVGFVIVHASVATRSFATPGARVEVPLTDVVDLSVGDEHACAVTADGRVHCWGSGLDYRLGNGFESASRTPIAVPGLRNVATVSAGGSMTCVLTRDREVLCWGGRDSADDSRDDEGTSAVSTPRTVATPIAGTVALSVGGVQATLVDHMGAVSILDLYVGPVPLPAFAPASTVRSLWDGFCTVTVDRRLQCVSSSESVVGDGGTGRGFADVPATILIPFAVPPSSVGDPYGVTCGDHDEGPRPEFCDDFATVASPAGTGKVLDTLGALACFIDGTGGGARLGCFGCGDCFNTLPTPLGMASYQASVPLAIALEGVPELSDLAVGKQHICVLAKGHRVFCWGAADEGQLGMTTPGRRAPLEWVLPRWSEEGQSPLVPLPVVASRRPVEVLGLGEVERIEAGLATTCALRRDRTVVCWGHELGTWRDSERRPLIATSSYLSDQGDLAPAEPEPELTRPIEPDWSTQEPGKREGPCRDVDVYGLGALEEAEYGYDGHGRVGIVRQHSLYQVDGELRRELESEVMHKRNRRGHIVKTTSRVRRDDGFHESEVVLTVDRHGRVLSQKARNTVDDSLYRWRYDRQGRVIAELSDGSRIETTHHTVDVAAGDPIGLGLPTLGPVSLVESRTPRFEGLHRRLVATSAAGDVVYERKVLGNDVVSRRFVRDAQGRVTNEHVVAHRFGFYETPTEMAELRYTYRDDAPQSVRPTATEQWEQRSGKLVLVKRTLHLESGCVR